MATCVFDDPLALAVLRWDRIEELSFLDMEYPVPRRFRSRRRYLDVLNIDSEAFRQQFRFEQMDLSELYSALRVPDTIRTAQNVAIHGQEGLCILLRRLSYLNRLCDPDGMFGHHSSTLSSATTVVLNHLTSISGQLTANLYSSHVVNRASLDEFSETEEEMTVVSHSANTEVPPQGFIQRPVCPMYSAPWETGTEYTRPVAQGIKGATGFLERSVSGGGALFVRRHIVPSLNGHVNPTSVSKRRAAASRRCAVL
ncbi:hypothetical protein HPB47_018909 [Ixodes persulcatus]|uniref:Uncharacterized protein n=1 Tax=Ixodes persulcatus TaxID=34615 RepID=A0AC60QJJ3_IXOPE|nr:hypothetical protein HPB47_018909 [Ixodes persulcatus]